MNRRGFFAGLAAIATWLGIGSKEDKQEIVSMPDIDIQPVVIEDMHEGWKPIAASYNPGDSYWSYTKGFMCRCPIESTIKIAFQHEEHKTMIKEETYSAFNCRKANILDEKEWVEIFNSIEYEHRPGYKVNPLPMFVVKDGSKGKFGGCPFRLTSIQMLHDLEFLFDPYNEYVF
jgi:hypothetical protein